MQKRAIGFSQGEGLLAWPLTNSSGCTSTSQALSNNQPPKNDLNCRGEKKENGQSLQLIDNFLQVIGLHLPGHDFHHFLADLPDLLVLGIGGLADLVVALLGEAHTEEAQQVPIRGFDIHVGFNHCLQEEAPNIYPHGAHPTPSDVAPNTAVPGTGPSLPLSLQDADLVPYTPAIFSPWSTFCPV